MKNNNINLYILFGMIMLMSTATSCRTESQIKTDVPLNNIVTATVDLGESTQIFASPTLSTLETPTILSDDAWKEDLTILLQYALPDIGFGGDISISYPFESSRDILLPTEEFAYCCSVLSPDGNKYSYLRRFLPEEVDTLWIMQFDGTNQRQIREVKSGKQLAHGATEIYPFGWSPDGRDIFAHMTDGIVIIDAETGEDHYFNSPYGAFIEYFDITGELILVDEYEGYTIKFVDLLNLETTLEIIPPAEYSPVSRTGEIFSQGQVSLSPDRELFAIADFDYKNMNERLWIVNIPSRTWRLVISNDAKWGPDNVSWSPDKKYLAWLGLGRDAYSEFYLQIYFVDTSTYQIVSSYRIDSLSRSPKVLDWVDAGEDIHEFGAYIPEVGIVLINPVDTEKESILVPYEKLEEILPLSPDEILDWSWLPRYH